MPGPGAHTFSDGIYTIYTILELFKNYLLSKFFLFFSKTLTRRKGQHFGPVDRPLSIWLDARGRTGEQCPEKTRTANLIALNERSSF